MTFQIQDPKEEKEKQEWETLKYSGGNCPNCGRCRVEICTNGKHWCDKCDWVVEDNQYFRPDWRI